MSPPPPFRPDTPVRRRLRRKPRAAEAAGVTVQRAEGGLPLGPMTALAARWAAARGGERGFSMGRIAPDYAAGQRVYLARAGGRPVAFASFHEGAREWTLDLLRMEADAPDGTAHALVAAAIAEAAALGLPRLSLAAVRVADRWPPAAERMAARVPGDGLRQFKAAFDPAWETLCAAAPTRAALAIGLWDVAWRIHRPAPLAGAAPAAGPDRPRDYPVAAR